MSRWALPSGAAVLLGVLVVACSSAGPDSRVCERAALDQAAAEQRWGQLLEEHAYADETLAESTSAKVVAAHDESAEFLTGARVDMILAEAETRRQCG